VAKNTQTKEKTLVSAAPIIPTDIEYNRLFK